MVDTDGTEKSGVDAREPFFNKQADEMYEQSAEELIFSAL